MHSVWDSTVSFEKRPPLQGDTAADVVVIGAGMCGVLTAWHLQQEGLRVAVVEAGRTGSGQTHLTTAKITAQHGLFYDNLVRTVGYARAKQYADANRKAVKQYALLTDLLGIDCDFKKANSFLYTGTAKGMTDLEREKTAALALGIECTLDKSGFLCFPCQAQFNPLPFLFALARRLTIYEDTLVTRVSSHSVHTNRGDIFCKHVVFACHYPFPVFPGQYFMRMYQERSYVVAADLSKIPESPRSGYTPACLLPDRDAMYYGIDEGGISIRFWNSRVLVGGQGHRTGKNQVRHRYEFLRQKALEYWPGCEITAQWSAQDCISLDRIPYIGTFSPGRPNWYVATGFGKWGMTSSMVSALILTELICRKSSHFADVFSPGRHLSKMALASFRKEMKESTAGLLKGIAGCGLKNKKNPPAPISAPSAEMTEFMTKKVAPGEGKLLSCGGKKIGVYRDNKDLLHLIVPQCSHLGCLLNWNAEEKTWDCPCHGSRFTYEGRLLDGPAQLDIPSVSVPAVKS